MVDIGSADMKLRFEIVLEDDEGGFHAYCPDLPGLHTDGRTAQEALSNTKDAILAYLNSLAKHDQPAEEDK